MERTSRDSWDEWRRHVLTELERLNENNRSIDASIDDLRESLHEELAKMNIEIATLKIKSGIWGMFAGLIPVTIAVLMKLMK